MKCPSCDAQDQTGSFCAQCGASLDATCPGCGAKAALDARYCTQCGAALDRGDPSAPRSRAGWYIGAVALLVVILVLMLPRVTDRAGPASMTGGPSAAPGAPAGGGTVPGGTGRLSSDMRTNADRLFNRIMTAAEQGDRAQVDQFMPMAVQAYGMVEDLDDDGIYHLAILHLTAEQYDQARETAERILASSPDHILALGLAAEASAAMGEAGRADEYYRRLLDAYPEEAARPLPEYVEHQPMLTEYRRLGRERLGEG